MIPDASTLLGRIIRLPFRLIPSGATVRILSGRTRGMKWIVGSTTNDSWVGTFERKMRSLFERLVCAGDTVYDIGASVGDYTLLASVLVGPDGHVIAFEPSPRNVHYLRRHVEMNHLRNVTIVEAAVADHEGSSRFAADPMGSLGSLSALGDLEVQVTSIDQCVSSGRHPPPQVIKIDVEGGELAVLRGAHQTIAIQKPIIFLSTHGSRIKKDCLALLSSAGYVIEPLKDSGGEILARTDHEGC